MNLEIINLAKQKVADKGIAFDLALKSGKSEKIKVAATELAAARNELKEAEILTPQQRKIENQEFLDRITKLRNEGNYYEAMELAHQNVKRK